ALHDVAAKLVADAERRFDVHFAAGLEPSERGARERLRDDVEPEPPFRRLHDGEADARDGDGVANRRAGRGLGRRDDEPGAGEGLHPAELADDAREHATRLRLVQVRLQQHVLSRGPGAEVEELERPLEVAEDRPTVPRPDGRYEAA